MKLQQKFKQWLDTKPRVQLRDIQLEVIADEYAIDFVFWLMLNCELIKDEKTEENVLWRYDSEDYIIDTLLEIFKREKGL